jgi:hypothetical protein
LPGEHRKFSRSGQLLGAAFRRFSQPAGSCSLEKFAPMIRLLIFIL